MRLPRPEEMAPRDEIPSGNVVEQEAYCRKTCCGGDYTIVLGFSSEPLPYNGVRLTLDLIESRSRLLIFETHCIETENLTVASSLRERVKNSVERERILRFTAAISTRGETFNLIPGFDTWD